MAVSITKDNYDKEISQSTMPVVIDVFASWCVAVPTDGTPF